MIAGHVFLERAPPENEIFYTTCRLTSEMMIKCVKMGVPINGSRSGFTARGVNLALKANVRLIAGEERIAFDAVVQRVEEEVQEHPRKGDGDG